MNIISAAERPFSQKELYQFVLWLEKGEVSKMLSKLEEHGYLRREMRDHTNYIGPNV
jgi:uncharacterized membrane protein